VLSWDNFRPKIKDLLGRSIAVEVYRSKNIALMLDIDKNIIKMIDLVVPMKKFLDTQKEVDPSN
jgi:hypothetical protein